MVASVASHVARQSRRVASPSAMRLLHHAYRKAWQTTFAMTDGHIYGLNNSPLY